jgi:hypothetical protein
MGRFLLLGMLAALATGCGAVEDGQPVEGIVSLDGKPLAHATVTWHPQGDTKGHGGSGRTDETGRYRLTTPYQKKTLVAGSYKVVISHRRNPDGSLPPPNDQPIDSPARETLPPRYSSTQKTELTFELSSGEKKSADFALLSDG